MVISVTVKYERLTKYPRDMAEDLAEISLHEFLEDGPLGFGVAGLATHIWRVTDGDDVIIYASVYHANLFGTPELGVSLGKAFEKNPVRSLIACRTLMRKLVKVMPRLRARVDEGFAAGLAFAKLFGFRHIDTRHGYHILEI